MTKNWLITGTSSGLGRLLVERLLARGDRVAATVRQAAVLDDLAAQYGERLRVLTLDVTDANAVRETVARAFAAMGRIDVVVSNAGYGLFGAAEEVTDEQLDKQIATNLTGSIQLIRASLPYLRAQGGGRIVQVSSEGGQCVYPGFSLYHATKWGIEGFVEAVALEVAPFGIDFIIVEPGPTETSFGSNLVSPEPMPVYDATPVGELRRRIGADAFARLGDAGKTVDAMIVASDAERPARRLTLGSSAYQSISKALAVRLAELEAQKSVALEADVAES
ncbi:SDR family oxidoreductase [Paraburkholderia phenazinium]|uniref:Short-chain dehydrogenase n=1 Tax=Paraburkholderia phenazinium TaxID=60549 RepID=A0A1G8IIB5_9BURK|nr:SDR family oxidoreductase [Paraburkholderia phenazinium]SDI18676.1 Short-chain dehydrogenase [Paraburkholderia phenazinium]